MEKVAISARTRTSYSPSDFEDHVCKRVRSMHNNDSKHGLKRSSRSSHRRGDSSSKHDRRKGGKHRDHRSEHSHRSKHSRSSGGRVSRVDSPKRDKRNCSENSWDLGEMPEPGKSRLSERLSHSLGYTDSENPFGDSSLTSTFVWVKKKRDGSDNLNPEERKRREEQRRKENEDELEKLKRRREEREIELQQRERDQLRLQRERDMMETNNWELNENSFYLEQTKLRTLIRAKEDRMAPIDILAMNIIIAYDEKISQQFLEIGVNIIDNKPYAIFEYLNFKELEDLHKDIQNWIYLDEAPDSECRAYWQALLVVSEMELEKRRSSQNSSVSNHYTAVNSSIVEEIDLMLKDKTPEKLDLLQKQIMAKLGSGEPVDTEYWEVAVKLLIVWKSKLTLQHIHKKVMDICYEKVMLFEKENTKLGRKVAGGIDVSKNFFKLKAEPAPANDPASSQDDISNKGADKPQLEDQPQDSSDSSLSTEEYDPEMSPKPWQMIPISDSNIEVLDSTVFEASLKQAREAAHQAYLGSADPSSIKSDYGMPSEYTLEQNFLNETAESMDMEDNSPTDVHMEPEFIALSSTSNDSTTQESLSQKGGPLSKHASSYYWYDRYRPRKPRYLNRVHTGYEWNKYNQTHYDSDNPPPKVIQGYKFNIFYPDLIEKNISPTYVREKDPANPETRILRFKAGPPYEDIAFRIMNREWEYSHKKGFRSSFDKGVLQLWFHFKRHYYRR